LDHGPWPVLPAGEEEMIDVDEWAEIRRLHFAEGMGIKAIARRLGVARNTVRSAVGSSDPPRYERQRRPSVVDAFEPEIRKLLKEFPEMPFGRASIVVGSSGASAGTPSPS
jgi:transposase